MIIKLLVNNGQRITRFCKNPCQFAERSCKTDTSTLETRSREILISESKDIDRIEHTLDALCEVAFDEEVLIVFKKLCRYYLTIDPVATYEYINIYKDMWDNEVENDSDK